MNQKLHKDLSTLLDFFLMQRSNPPEQLTYKPKLINKPGFFTLKALQQHLNNPLLKPEWVHIKTEGKTVLIDTGLHEKNVQRRLLHFMDKNIIERELRKGGAVVLEGLDILDPGINAFCAKLEEALPCSLTNSVAFFSQARNEAYDGHADSDDVLVIQLSGKKTWDIFEPQQRRYLGNENQNEHQLGPVMQQITMSPGDALYVRAGVPHRCHTAADHSMHISFDLLDRTPNVDQITKEASQKYYHACALPYVPADDVINKYVELLQSPEFKVSVEKQTRQIRENSARFREQVERASGVRFLSKFK